MKAHLVAITLFTGLLSGCEHQNNTEAHPASPLRLLPSKPLASLPASST